jgi:hypothetical protein
MTPYQRWLSNYDEVEMAKSGKKIVGWIVIGLIVLSAVLGWVISARAEEVNLKASWYSVESLKKEGTWKNGETKMANGKRFNEEAFTLNSEVASELPTTKRGKASLLKLLTDVLNAFKVKELTYPKGHLLRLLLLNKVLYLLK